MALNCMLPGLECETHWSESAALLEVGAGKCQCVRQQGCLGICRAVHCAAWVAPLASPQTAELQSHLEHGLARSGVAW